MTDDKRIGIYTKVSEVESQSTFHSPSKEMLRIT